MDYFVTGATGFIGRFLVERLLGEHDGDIHVLVRESSRARLERLIRRWPDGERRVHAVPGDLTEPHLGIDPAWIAAHRGRIGHAFHVAAIYDMHADAAYNERTNVNGTANVIALMNELEVGCVHHVSSIAVAGLYEGTFRETMFDEGQALPSPYHRTKFEAEAIVRERAEVPYRIYRPAIVVGHSQSGEMDKVDGPYYLFKLMQRLAEVVPSWAPLAAPKLGRTNIVPVDYVAAALEHIAHQPGLDGETFHLVHPTGQRLTEVYNAFAKAASAPRLVLRSRLVSTLVPTKAAAAALEAPGIKQARDLVLGQLGIPPTVADHAGFSCRFDSAHTQRALSGSGIAVPELETYAAELWAYWQHHLDPSPKLNKAFAKTIRGKTVVITGASSGIGKETAIKIAQAGGTPILVARSLHKLEDTRDAILRMGGDAYAYSCDLSDLDAIDELVDVLLAGHERIHVLINNAGRSIRRSVSLSHDRFHDFERTIKLNYLGAVKLTMGLLPHMQVNGGGHITNISSIGVQTAPPRFAAYVASKAALDAWSRVVSAEVIGDGVTFTTIHMPLVRTPMIAPTKIYEHAPAISPSEAADWICASIVARPKHINTTLGTFGEVAYALTPKVVDQVLHAAYRVFPESAAARGVTDEQPEPASLEQIAMANALRGVHW